MTSLVQYGLLCYFIGLLVGGLVGYWQAQKDADKKDLEISAG